MSQPVLYQGYCYPDANSVIDVIKTSGNGGSYVSGQYLLNDVVQNNGNIDLDYYILPSFDSFNVSIPIINCESVGPYVNYTGLTLDDAIELSWLMGSVLLTVYLITLLRKAL